MPRQTDNPVALITAGGQGIGKAIARCLSRHGFFVHMCDIDEHSVHGCKGEERISATVADAANIGDIERVFADITKRYSRLDVLVNNVGIAGPTAPVEDIAVCDWRRTIDVDLNSAFYCARLAVPLLRRNGGCIINMASNAAMLGFPLRSPYAAAKWALIGLTKTWAMELGKDKIRVNALCPGSVEGKRIDDVIAKDAIERGMKEPELRSVYRRQSSMRTFIDPDDIAETVRFLCSPAARHISGQVIGIDGHTEGLINWFDP